MIAGRHVDVKRAKRDGRTFCFLCRQFDRFRSFYFSKSIFRLVFLSSKRICLKFKCQNVTGGSEPPMPRRCRGQYDPLRIFVGGIPTDIGNGIQDLNPQFRRT